MTSYMYRKSKNLSSFFKLHISFSLRNFSSGNRVIAAEYLKTHHEFSKEVASKFSSICRSIDPENCDSIISVLKTNGFSQTDVERIFGRNPNIVAANSHKTVEPKIKVFLDSGFSPAETADLFVTDPTVLHRSANHLSSTISKLKEILGCGAKAYRFLKAGQFPSTSLEKNLIPNIKLLHSFGLKSEQIGRYMCQNPIGLSLRTERMMEIVERAEEFGISRSSNMLLLSIRSLACLSKTTWERKLKVFNGLGFGEDDIALMIRRMPKVFNVSEKKIKKMTKFLVSTGDVDISTIAGRPLLLMYSLEKRLKPRLKVIQALKKKNLLHGKLDLSFGLQLEQIQRYIPKSPRYFCARTVKMMELVNKAEELGISRSCKMLLPTMRTLNSLSKGSWERKLKVFRGLGFREDEIAQMLRRMPLVISVSEGKIKEITEFLVSNGEGSISLIARYPFVLMFSLEKRLKPRLQVLQALKGKRLIDEKHTLITACKMTDVEFVNKFGNLPPPHSGHGA